MKMNEKQRFNSALEVFLNRNKFVQKEIQSLTPEGAKAIGLSFDELRENELQKLFIKHAESLGQTPYELVLSLTVESEEEKAFLITINHKSTADMLGMTWDEYLDINPHLKSE
jgi:Family of unknown function (DUF6388)